MEYIGQRILAVFSRWMAASQYIYFMTYFDRLRLNTVCEACYSLAPVKRDRLSRFRDEANDQTILDPRPFLNTIAMTTLSVQ